MKNPYEVLRQKELDLARIRHEVEALRSVLPLLTEMADSSTSTTTASSPAIPGNRWPLKLDDPPKSYVDS